jgi:predicted DCC family thiol-disulfide oxidoreductase YuxK
VVPVAVLPWQKAPLELYSLSREQAGEAAWWIEPSGRRHRGHRAIGQALVACGGGWSLAGRLLLLPPPVAWVAALGYRVVARLRHRLPGTTPACRTSWPFDSAHDRPCR